MAKGETKGKTEHNGKTDHAEPAEASQALAQPVGISWEKKITTKAIVGKVSAVTVKDGMVKLYSIIGICTGFKMGESQYGGWTGFTGTFEATRLADGKTYAAPVAFVPEPASGMMLSAIEQQRRQGIADPSVQFAFIIGAKPSDKASGFEYVVEPVMQASQNDALATLRAQIAPRLALPAA